MFLIFFVFDFGQAYTGLTMTNDSLIAIIEDIDSKFDLMVEMMVSLAPLPMQVRLIDERLERVESDVKVIKSVVIEQSRELHDHEKRIAKLETAKA